MDHDASVVYEANQSHIHDHQDTQGHVGHSDASNYHDQQNQHNNIEQFQPQENAMPAEVQQPAPPQPAQYPPPQGNKPSSGYNPAGPSGPQVNFMFQNNNAGPNRPASYFQPQPAGQGQRGQMNNPPVQYPHQQYYQTNPAYSNGVHQPRLANPPGFAQNMGPHSGYQQGGPPPASFPPNSNGHMDYGINSGYVGPSPVHGNGAAAGIPIPNPGPPVQVMPMKVPTEGWKTGLFECMDDPNNAVITAFCPCITFGQVAEILDNGHSSCTTSGLMYGLVAFLIGIPCIMSCSYRTKLRSKFNLIETPAPDWVTHFLCEWCALCQEYRELQLRGLDPSIGWQGNVDRVQAGFRQQPANMVPPMNQRMMP